jgi:hypothetical protein
MKTSRRSTSKVKWVIGTLLTFLFLIGCNLLSNPGLPAGGKNLTPGGSPQPAGAAATPAFDFTAGLDQLHSYHVEFHETEKGQLDGKPYETRNTISRRVVVQPYAEDSTVDNLLVDGSQFFLQFIRIGDAQYIQDKSGGTCQGTLDSQQNGQIPNPAVLLPPVYSAEKLGVETLNGTQVTHYRFDAQALGLRARTATGEMWLADQGGLVVKYQLDIQPPNQLTGKGLEIQRSMQYELSEINQLDQIALPSICIQVLSDIPAMPDAVDLERSSASMSFTTASSPSQVATFYDQKLLTLGWNSTAQQNQSPQKNLVYTRNQQTLMVSFFQDGSDLDVEIMLTDPAYQYPTAETLPTETLQPGVTPSPPPTPQATPTFDMAQSGLPQDVPLYPGASNIQAANGMGISFQTGDSLDQVAKFYTDALKSAGWQLANNNNMGKVVIQTWLKGTTILNLNIQDQQAQRMVTIMAAAKP